jgi:CDP-paratose 2-epimerase
VLETIIERPFDIPWMVLDAILVEQVWGWKLEISIEEVLEEISKFASEQQDWCRLSST